MRDSLDRTASATITVRVVALPAVNLLPITTNDLESVAPGGAVDIAVLANDRDPDGGALTLVSVTSPSRGRADRIGNGVRYTAPNDDGGGVVVFGYTVVDDEGGTAIGSVSVQIAPERCRRSSRPIW
ncbi:MAG: Ig-like domain-containing protein [Ilumatobacteraceae bacterium]